MAKWWRTEMDGLTDFKLRVRMYAIGGALAFSLGVGTGLVLAPHQWHPPAAVLRVDAPAGSAPVHSDAAGDIVEPMQATYLWVTDDSLQWPSLQSELQRRVKAGEVFRVARWPCTDVDGYEMTPQPDAERWPQPPPCETAPDIRTSRGERAAVGVMRYPSGTEVIGTEPMLVNPQQPIVTAGRVGSDDDRSMPLVTALAMCWNGTAWVRCTAAPCDMKPPIDSRP